MHGDAETPVPAKSAKRWRWHQIGLRTLLVFFTIAIVLTAAWSIYIRPWEIKDAVRLQIEEVGGTYRARAGPKWLGELIGPEHCQIITEVTLATPGNNMEPIDAGESLLRSLGKLTELESIDVAGQPVTDNVLSDWNELSGLAKLVLDRTVVQHPQDWPSWPLRELHISATPMEESDFAALSRYAELTVLNVSNSGFGDKEIEAIGNLAQLERLFADNSRVTLSGLQAVRSYPNLESFSMYGWLPRDAQYQPELRELESGDLGALNRISSIAQFEDNIQNRLQQLKTENLSYNTGRFEYMPGGIEWLHLDAMGVREDASSVSASSVYFDDEIMARLEQFPNLRSLSLHNSWITDAGLKQLSHCPHLEHLILTDARVSDAGLEQLLRCPKLEFLSLAGTRVTHRGLATIAKLPELRSLILPAAALRGQEIRVFAELPNLRLLKIAPPGLWDVNSRVGEPLGIRDLREIQAVAKHFEQTPNVLPHVPLSPRQLRGMNQQLGAGINFYLLLKFDAEAQAELQKHLDEIERAENALAR